MNNKIIYLREYISKIKRKKKKIIITFSLLSRINLMIIIKTCTLNINSKQMEL